MCIKYAAISKVYKKRLKIVWYQLVFIFCSFMLNLNFCDTKGYFLIPSIHFCMFKMLYYKKMRKMIKLQFGDRMYHRLLYLCVSFWIEHKLLKLKELMVKDKKTTVTKENFFFLWAYFISFWYIPVFDGWCNSYKHVCTYLDIYIV